jgi:hypothetical protein
VRGNTAVVKTAIVLPDDLYDRVTARAHELAMSHSEFFVEAAVGYLAGFDGSVVEEEDCDASPGSGTHDPGAATAWCPRGSG